MQSSESFRISSRLKDIIGRDLVTNEYVAIFELVKNSFDARATSVDIEFHPIKG
ncbi:ATP-binding protein [Asaia prunellae]|uniref:ATP-binding protein n=1 Tax=Asaia prunellae TaxID=610245 RepID=UPI000AA14D44